MASGQSEAERWIRTLHESFVRHFNAGNADQLVEEFYTEDARLLPPNQPTVEGKTQIREALRQFLGELGFGRIEIQNTDFGSAGDLAYCIGTYTLGKPGPDRGKYIELYRRQADGSWRCIADMFSSDQEAG